MQFTQLHWQFFAPLWRLRVKRARRPSPPCLVLHPARRCVCCVSVTCPTPPPPPLLLWPASLLQCPSVDSHVLSSAGAPERRTEQKQANRRQRTPAHASTRQHAHTDADGGHKSEQIGAICPEVSDRSISYNRFGADGRSVCECLVSICRSLRKRRVCVCGKQNFCFRHMSRTECKCALSAHTMRSGARPVCKTALECVANAFRSADASGRQIARARHYGDSAQICMHDLLYTLAHVQSRKVHTFNCCKHNIAYGGMHYRYRIAL